MTRLSSCPNCWRPVLVPPAAVRQSRVRCPLCNAEFELRVLQEAVLPELVLLDGASEGEHALADSSASSAGDSASRSSSDVLGDYRGAREGLSREGEAPAEPRVWEGEAREGEAPAEPFAPRTAHDSWRTMFPSPAIDGDGEAAHGLQDNGSAVELANEGFAPHSDGGSAGASPSQEMPSRDTAFNFYASPTSHDDGAPVEVAARTGKRRETNMAIEMLKVVVGGFVGLVIAYGVLLVFFQRDPLNLADSLPRWMVPAALETDESSP